MEGLSSPGGAPALGTYTTLFRLLGADLNTLADQPFVPAMKFSKYIIDGLLITNASTAILLAAGGLYTGPNKTGTIIVAATQTYTGLTTTSKVIRPSITTAGQDLLTAVPILSLTTAMGSPATVDCYLMGLAG
jgi:hypothetical protein